MKRLLPRIALLIVMLVGGTAPAFAQLFDNLRALGGLRYSVGDPQVTVTNRSGEVLDGPKDIVLSDLDGDGAVDLVASDKDGSVTVRFGNGQGEFGEGTYLRVWTGQPRDVGPFSVSNVTKSIFCDYQPISSVPQCYTNIIFPPMNPASTNLVCVTNAADNAVTCSNVIVFLPPVGPTVTNIFCQTNVQYGCVGTITNWHTNIFTIRGPFGLRGLAVADFTGDGLGDIAVAAPGEELIYLFSGAPGRTFSAPTTLPGWFGVRDLTAGDFDGDGRADLVAAGTTNGLVQFRSLGGGNFEAYPPLLALASGDEIDEDDYEFPQPAYYLKAFRYPGQTHDELVVSFAQRRKIWVLRPDVTGRLEVAGDIENVTLTALDVGPILRPATVGAPPDLVTAYSRGGDLRVFAATNLTQRFSGQPTIQTYVPGAPRNVRIVDLDQDGWNDVVVVAQLNDRVLIYKNDHGRLNLTAETFAGHFPREMDVARINDDDRPDLAVLNRYSSDVSVFITATNLDTPVGFLALDSIYPVDGSVSGLDLMDFNRDGRPDVMQLHRDTSEFSVRLTDATGRLGPPTYYAITNAFNPAAQVASDVNSDGYPDMVSANLSGSVTIRLGRADGTFGAEQTFSLPEDARGGLFAVAPGDFNKDGKIDIAAGYLDCRVSLFKGYGDGTFTFVRTDPFIYEPRSMAAADVDEDGDLDLVGASVTGKFMVVENLGNWFSGGPLRKVEFAGTGYFDTNLRIVDQNNDGDPDLLFGYPGGFTLFIGAPGIDFRQYGVDNGSNDPKLSGNTFVFADLDGDGDRDIASICSSNSCLSIQVFTNNQFIRVLTVPVPITRYLSTADLDGDGFADLVGSGDVLWVALSSRKASNAPPSSLLANRGSLGVVINEILPANSAVPLVADAGRNSDFVELYNASTTPAALSGWWMAMIRTNIQTMVTNGFGTGSSNQLVLATNTVVTTNVYSFPAGATMTAGSHVTLVCSDRLRSPLHTGFNLPAEGAVLVLHDATGAIVDRVVYPGLSADQAYARYTDGARRFVVNSIPSPSAANVDNGAVVPTLNLTGVDLDSLTTPGQRLRFRAFAQDDIGLVNVSLLWRRLDIPDNETKRVILYDDGMNEDGPANDNQFFGVFDQVLPPGAEIQFYLECTDITGQVETSPGSPRFVSAGQPADIHALALGGTKPALEVSELVVNNVNGLPDELGGRPSWVELRNTSTQPISLASVSLGPRLFGNSDRMSFTNRPSIAPGEHLVIFADANPSQGQLHAPFQLSQLGGQVQLIGTTPTGARFPIDVVTYAPQSPDVALSRLGPSGPFVPNQPTPRAANVTGPWQSFLAPPYVHFVFPTRPGTTYVVEGKVSLDDPTWTELKTGISTGLEAVLTEVPQPSLFLRVREQ